MNRMRSSVLGSTFQRTTSDRRRGALLVAILSAFVMFALGCDSGTQEPEAPAAEVPATPEASDAGAPADSAGEAAAPVAREGEIDSSRFPTELPEGATAAIPDNFPSDMPIYPGSQPAQGKGIEIEGSPHSALQLLTNDALADVHQFYSAEMASKGWTIDADAETDASASLQATKGDCKANVLITPAQGGGSDIFIVSEC